MNEAPDRPPDETEALAIATSYVCDGCGETIIEPSAIKPSARIVSIKRTDKGFVTKGRGEVAPCRCPRCGAMLEVVEHMIPIECAAMTCPGCGRVPAWRCRIDSVEANGSSFQFVAEIECKRCATLKRLARGLDKLADAVSIEIGPTGVKAKLGRP